MSPRHPSLESLRVLEACVRHANFTRAAAELGVTPAAVSLRIRELEADLGITLFQRSGPRVAPTGVAKSLAGRVSEALTMLHAALTESVRTVEPLRVTVAPTIAMRWLAPRLPQYHALPDSAAITLDVSAVCRTAQEFDIAIRTDVAASPGFECAALMPVESTPMLSPALAEHVSLKSPRDLAALPLLPHDDWPGWFAAAGVSFTKCDFYVDDYPTHELDASAAIEGAGVALLSPAFYGKFVQEGKLLQPFPEVLTGPYWHYALLHRGEARPTVRHFLEWLGNEARTTAGHRENDGCATALPNMPARSSV